MPQEPPDPPDDAESRKAAAREYHRNYQRELIRKRRDAGLCIACGRSRQESATVLCPECADRKRKNEAARVARRDAEKRRAEAERPAPVPRPRVCQHCAGELRPCGRARGTRKFRYQCKACGKNQVGDAPLPTHRLTPPLRFPCPNPGCDGLCQKYGREKDGTQRYYCPTCKRQNTGLWPTENRHTGIGPCRHRFHLCISLSADKNLNLYCNYYGLSQAQAIRKIFGAMADEPRRPMSAGGRPVQRVPAPREPIPARLPNVSREAATKRMRDGNGNREHLSVLVIRHINVYLDDTAYQGLLRFMRKTGMNHQDAARHLIEYAK